MAESKGNKVRKTLIIVLLLLGFVTTAVLAYKAIGNPNQLETTPSLTAEAEGIDTAVESADKPPTATIPPTETLTPTATDTPTNSTAPRTIISITPELFIYHTP